MTGNNDSGKRQGAGAAGRHHLQSTQDGSKSSELSEYTHDGRKETGAMSAQNLNLLSKRVTRIEFELRTERQRSENLLRRVQRLEAEKKSEKKSAKEDMATQLVLAPMVLDSLYHAAINHLHLMAQRYEAEPTETSHINFSLAQDGLNAIIAARLH